MSGSTFQTNPFDHKLLDGCDRGILQSPDSQRSFVLRLFLLMALFATALSAHAEQVTLTIKVVLVDAQLNQRPVPRLALSVRSNDPGISPIVARTNFDGVTELRVTPGRYVISSDSPTTFDGKEYQWAEPIEITSPITVELSNDNAKTSNVASPARPVRVVDELSTMFSSLKNGVVTVWSEMGHGTGFIVDEAGLVITNEHVVSGSRLTSVQFDERRKVRAQVVASNPEQDIAILRIAPKAFDGATVLKIAQPSNGEPTLIEGERVFTIGSPLNQRKIITSGIVSKIESRAIISDVNINHGNSGGPLFNSVGEVVGVTTFGDLPQNGGPGISGVIRIEEAAPLLAEARRLISSQPAPEAHPLPVEPVDTFPLDAIKTAITAEKFNIKPYQYGIGGFDVVFSTPVVYYRLSRQKEMEAVKGKERRNRHSAQAIQGTFNPAQDLRLWEEYLGAYKPQLLVRARPQLREGFWSAFGRGMAMSQGMYGGPANMAFQADFYGMKLFCGAKEVEPIQPAKAPIVINEDNAFIRVKDATFEGAYFYPADAISPQCGVVSLQIFTEKKPSEPIVLNVRPDTIQRVWSDFEPYRKQAVNH
jgi:Trypsin-like serine proteases, typically periplasmic, contain C-terminal PDZ domain